MKTIKTIIQYILTILLALAIISYFIIVMMYDTILNKDYVIDKLETSNYYNKIYEQTKSNFENYIPQSGFELQILENVITKEKIKNDTQIILENVYDGTNKEINVQEIKDAINQNILNSLEDKKINKTQQKAIKTFIEHIAEEYITTLSHFNIENKINQMYQKAIEYINLSKKIIIIFVALDIFILCVINLKKINRFVSGIGSSLTIVGILLIISDLFIKAKITIQNITILNSAISDILRTVLIELMSSIRINGQYFALIGIILMVLAHIMKNIKETKTKENN